MRFCAQDARRKDALFHPALCPSRRALRALLKVRAEASQNGRSILPGERTFEERNFVRREVEEIVDMASIPRSACSISAVRRRTFSPSSRKKLSHSSQVLQHFAALGRDTLVFRFKIIESGDEKGAGAASDGQAPKLLPVVLPDL